MLPFLSFHELFIRLLPAISEGGAAIWNSLEIDDTLEIEFEEWGGGEEQINTERWLLYDHSFVDYNHK